MNLFIIALFVHCACVFGFLLNINPIIKSKKIVSFSLCVKTCFADDHDSQNEDKNKQIRYDEEMSKINFTNIDYHHDIDIISSSFYTLVWYDCAECKELLERISKENKKLIYINGGYYFYDIYNKENKGDPLLYKNDDFIADNIFEIYAELFQ